jgi:hypothetical protein
MISLADELSNALDSALYTPDADAELDAWIARVWKLADKAPNRQWREFLGLLARTTRLTSIVAAGGGDHAMSCLAEWMEATERCVVLSDTSQLLASDAMTALADLAAVLESLERDESSGYLDSLEANLRARVEWLDSRLQDVAQLSGDATDLRYEAAGCYDCRDTLEWALNCLTYFRLEFPGRLPDFDVDRYRHMLIEPDKRFREVIKKAKREGWHQPDAEAPRAFWWRAT